LLFGSQTLDMEGENSFTFTARVCHPSHETRMTLSILRRTPLLLGRSIRNLRILEIFSKDAKERRKKEMYVAQNLQSESVLSAGSHNSEKELKQNYFEEYKVDIEKVCDIAVVASRRICSF
jgi:hypothetical protein